MPLQPPESDSKAESPIQTLPDCMVLSREKTGRPGNRFQHYSILVVGRDA